jgi:hypothetical protein
LPTIGYQVHCRFAGATLGAVKVLLNLDQFLYFILGEGGDKEGVCLAGVRHMWLPPVVNSSFILANLKGIYVRSLREWGW